MILQSTARTVLLALGLAALAAPAHADKIHKTDGSVIEVSILPETSPVANPGFDVTPARLVTGLITERGVCEASRAGLLGLYPERRDSKAKS